MDKDWYVYILQCGDGTLYTGITPDVQARFRAHSEGKGAKYTRGRGPLELLYTERLDSRSEALKREREIKRLSRLQKRKLIEGCWYVFDLRSDPDDPGKQKSLVR